MRIAIPLELSEYIRLKDGKILFKKELPEELKQQFNVFVKQFEKSKEKQK